MEERMKINNFALVTLAALFLAPELAAQTTFTFGGYVKMDAMVSKFYNGSVPVGNALRDFHFPGAIPVGGESDVFATNDYHAKESRFNLETRTRLGDGQQLRAFVEMDFLLAGQGDERVSNSFNPRLRHFFFQYGKWILGQTWTTFQILDIPEDLDFAGAADGIVFNRQPQIRFSTGSWQFAVENAETTLHPFRGGSRITSGSAFAPDLVARYNFGRTWGHLSLAGLLRQLNHEFDEEGVTKKNSTPGFGVTFGGLINLGERDDLRFQATGGQGLGRYAALNFANGAVIDADEGIEAIPSYLGFVGYRHFWTDKLRTNMNVSGVLVDNNVELSGDEGNEAAYSVSANLIYSPVPSLHFGVELMRGVRELENGANGKFDRLQFSGKYDFRFSTESTNEAK
jgi:hypothetical protein